MDAGFTPAALRQAIGSQTSPLLIVRGADTSRLDLAPQAAGLAATSLGLSRIDENDPAMLEHGMIVYDALYRWCKEGKQETHTWNPEAYK